MFEISLKPSNRNHNVVIESGLSNKFVSLLSAFHITLNNKKIFVITDETVASLYLPQLEQQLAIHTSIILPPGEATKSFYWLENIYETLLSHHIQRDSLIIALGGGVVGDIAGLVASTILRGVQLIQIPTTLLSQIDSSIGGKTAINTKYGKNLIGTFYQPDMVIIDPLYLQTLPHREFTSGLAEMVKYGLIDDLDFFIWLENNIDDILSLNINILKQAIYKCCQIKTKIVDQDSYETKNQRIMLNFGHTFGHILEAESMYDGRLLHGEAVSIGMCQACDLSQKLGLLEKSDSIRIKTLLSHLGLPTQIPSFLKNYKSDDELLHALMQHLKHDKKNNSEGLKFILLKGIGQALTKTDIDKTTIKQILETYIQATDKT